MTPKHDSERLQREFPSWRFWYGRRSDGQPGDLMATRRRVLSDAEMRAGLAHTLPMGLTVDLYEQLLRQSAIEHDLCGEDT